MRISWSFSLGASLLLSFAAMSVRAEQTMANAALKCTLTLDGKYAVKYAGPGWSLEGQLPGVTGSVTTKTGSDSIGKFHSLGLSFAGGARHAEIRVYDTTPVVELRDEWQAEGANVTPFPTFAHVPQEQEHLSFRTAAFAPYQFGKLNPQGPWIFFDKADHALAVSSADHFLVSKMTVNETGTAEIGIDPLIQAMPAGFVHSTLIVAGQGVRDTFRTWGASLLALGRKPPVTNTADALLDKMGYWTDNVTTYYYKFDQDKGYAGTLLAVRDEMNRLHLPVGNMQLDSWFYPKGPSPEGKWSSRPFNADSGEIVYRADPTLFPEGLKKFQENLGLPMITHARWISANSPYRQQYKMSGNIITDPTFWQSTAEYLRDSGVIIYEQDWLDRNALPETNLNDSEAFLREMNNAMQANGIGIQYCMPLPSHFMASTLYPAVRTIRPSNDGFTRARWDPFLYGSALAHAVGLWPWTDAYFSKDLGNLIISTLSAGPVGVGDAIGKFDVTNIMSAVRSDGKIIKPDAPLQPIDDMYIHDGDAENTPMIATGTTAFDKGVVTYVFAYPRRESEAGVSVRLSKLGVRGPVFAFDWKARAGKLLGPEDTIEMTFESGWAYAVLTPLNAASGIAMLGDVEKIVPMGRARISATAQHGAATQVTVQFASGEGPRAISGYAKAEPKIHTIKGAVSNFHYDAASHLFSALVTPTSANESVLYVRATKKGSH